MEPARAMKETVDLKSVFTTLWRRRWYVLVPAALAGLTAWVVSLPRFMKPVYQSSCTLMVEFPQMLSPGLTSLLSNPSMAEQMARLQSQIQSSDFLKDVITRTGLRNDASVKNWAVRSQRRYPDLSQDELIDLKLTDYLRGVIRMSAEGARADMGNVIRITVQDFSADGARNLVQTVTQSIIDANVSAQVEHVKSAGDFSAAQLQEYQKKLREAEDAVEAYRRRIVQRRSEPTLIEERTLSVAQDLRENAASELEQLERELSATQAALQSAGGGTAAVEAALADRGLSSSIAELRSLEQTFVRQTLLDAASGRASSQGSAISVARKVDQLSRAARSKLGSGVPAGASAAAGAYLDARLRRDQGRTRVEAYDGHLAAFRSRMASTPEADLELQRLQHDVDSYRQLQNAFAMQMASSQISEAYGASSLGRNKISILERPQLPLKPVRPQRGQILLLALFAGLGLGVGAVFVLEHHDPSFRDVREVERLLGLRVLATVPRIEPFQRMLRAGRAQDDAPLRAAEAERLVEKFLDESPGYHEFRKLVLGLYRTGAANPRTIMITSSRREEGKSTSSTCLALTLARELPGQRVVLVDLDTRRSSIGPFFGVGGNAPRGGCILSERRWVGEPLAELPLPNLRLLVPARERHSHSDLVTVESIRWLLFQLKERADRIVIDSPPNLPVPDALVIGAEVDAVLMVVKAGKTPRETARRGLELQRQFRDNVVGILMNDSGEVLPYYYNYRHYGYGTRSEKRG